MTANHPLDVADLRDRVGKALAGFIAGQVTALDAIAEELGPVGERITEFLLDGGKRLRPAFCYWGWRGAGGADTDQIVTAASSLELLQACALIHDDVMDGSDTRRGRPAVHRGFAALHRGEGWLGDPEAFGTSAAILLGDLCLIWADQMLNTSGLPAVDLHRAAPTYDEMRVELMAGQYLDVLEQALGGCDVERALRVARYKTAKYTIERPLHLGGVLAGAPPELLASYTAYGVPLGQAFQLRDDVLGVFGDPSVTGKPAGDDLREGKRTVLVAMALDRAEPGDAAVVRRHLGDPALDAAGVERLRGVIDGTGALAEVESLIARLTDEALAGLASAEVHPEAREVLGTLAAAATTRRG
ncbi:MAG TPA: polyprenyl synthetase family protein [Mycobacteriales bacterium]|nr:polyprenyl synthetase family protein [Mycobacteriales bacterium]